MLTAVCARRLLPQLRAILLFSSLFNSPQTVLLTLGQITIDKNLTINGTGQGLVTVSGNNASRIFFITGGVTVNLTGITFS